MTQFRQTAPCRKEAEFGGQSVSTPPVTSVGVLSALDLCSAASRRSSAGAMPVTNVCSLERERERERERESERESE